MKIQALGHVVLKVRDLERSIVFYRDILGMREVARRHGVMVFFSLGENHHDLALLQVGAEAEQPASSSVGLYHVAFKVGDSLEQLRTCKAHLANAGIILLGQSDHGVSQSLYLQDPDGITVELYVDTDPALWHGDPSLLLTVKPLLL
jgi:catechol 2,3-dioxygenase